MKILYPPHPKGKIGRKRLPRYERTGNYLAQLKFNGTHVVICVTADGDVYVLTRHGEPSKRFQLTEKHIKEFLSLDLEKGKEYWFAGELFHTRTTSEGYNKEAGGRIVLFDLLQAGDYLFGVDQVTRLETLEKICRHPIKLEPHHGVALVVTEHIWLAEVFDKDFETHWEKLIHIPEIEGLVLREKDAILDNTGHKQYDVGWMVRVRKPDRGGNYEF